MTISAFHTQNKIDKLEEMLESLRHDYRFEEGGIKNELCKAIGYLETASACLAYAKELQELD